ncbi:hypothetical protein [Candidatus Leptofilum sp.]|uniref:hypothetical protein n=1 Tax=Candidatus Leptofilum sp. TaxID=3241576 RepID=UPI003B5C2076
MTETFHAICATVKNQSKRIAAEVAQARYTSLGVQEETLTDLVLNRIQFEHEEHFFTRKFTRKEEGNLSGADWLWCIGEPGAWITFAVQAKITNIQTNRINYLHYKRGKQYSLLIDFCKQFGFIPKYSVYANVNEDIQLFSQNIPQLRNLSLGHWAFTAISPKYIKELSTPNEKHISNVLQFSIPWSYILCTKQANTKKLAQAISDNLEDLYWPLENEHRRLKKQKPMQTYKRIVWDNPQYTVK